MVHEKYIKKNGKIYGPYLYSNKRVNGKVVTSYLGSADNAKKIDIKKLYFLFGICLVILLIFVVFYSLSLTGRASLDVESSYKPGEKLSGNLSFNIKQGELIPKDSKVIVSLGGISKEFSLGDLVDREIVSGEFFIENSAINGSGEGYGIVGEKVSYPEINFDLRIFAESKENPIANKEENNTSNETKSEEVVNKEEANNGSKVDENIQKNTEETKKENENPTVSESPSSAPSEYNVPSAETSSGTEATSGSTGETTVTGAAVSESESIISGVASKDKTFTYNLVEGQNIELVEGSVKVNGSEINKNSLKLNVAAGKAEVSTDYSLVEKGFGKEYLGKNESKIEIDISKFGIIVNESTKLKISLVYNNQSLAGVEKDISVEEKIQKNLNESELNETIINETKTEFNRTGMNFSVIDEIPDIRIAKNGSAFLNLSDYFVGVDRYKFNAHDLSGVFEGDLLIIRPNEGFSGMRKAEVIAYRMNDSIESNKFRILVSSGAVSISTSRKKIVAGEPVSWIMNISLSSADNITIELPIEAENISVRKIVEGSEESSNAVITGMISAELDLNRNFGFVNLFKNLFRRFTGRAINDIGNNENNTVKVELKDSAKEYVIEYNTKGPDIEEHEIGRGKRVTVAGDDVSNYTDVIASSHIVGRIPISQASKIKVYWYNGENVGNATIKKVDEVENEVVLQKIESSEFMDTEQFGRENVNITNSIINGTLNGGDLVNDTGTEIIKENNSIIVNESNSGIITENNSIVNNETVVANKESSNSININNTNESIFGITGSVIGEINDTGTEIVLNETLASNNQTVNIVKKKTNVKSNRQEIPFDAYDLDGDGYMDYVEWVVPHLSNQTFDIILITKAEHLDENRSFVEDVYDYVKDKDDNWTDIPNGHYIRVIFENNLTSDRDITLYARSNYSSSVEVYERNKTNLITKFENISDESWYKVLLTNLTGSQDSFDLRVNSENDGFVSFDYIVDPTSSQTNTCGQLTTANNIYYLTGDANGTGTCFDVRANGVTIDGNGSGINYGTGSGAGVIVYGVNITGYNDTIVKNLVTLTTGGVSAAKHAIQIIDSFNTSIYNNTIRTNGTGIGININPGKYINITHNNINSSGSGDGISILGTSHNISVQFNNFTIGGAGGDAITLGTTNNNTIAYNFMDIRGNGNGVICTQSVNFTNVIYNNITNLGSGGGINSNSNSYFKNNFSFNNINITASSNGNGITLGGGFNNGTLFGNNISINGGTGGGISLALSSGNNLIAGNYIRTNGSAAAGIKLTNSQNNSFVSNFIYTSGDNSHGYSIGANCDLNNFTSNEVNATGRNSNAVRILQQNIGGGIIAFNNLTTLDQSSDTIFLNSANNTIFLNNRIIANGTGSAGILFINSNNNTFMNNSILVLGSGMNSSAIVLGAALGFANGNVSDGNRFFDTSFNVVTLGTNGTTFNTGTGGIVNFTNVTISSLNLTAFLGTSSVTVNFHWYLDAQVNNSINNVISGANVTGSNNSAGIKFSVLTYSNGFIPRQVLLDYSINKTEINYQSNYTINATNADSSTQSKPLNLSLMNNTFLAFTVDSIPLLSFVASTLANGSVTQNNFVIANISITEPLLQEARFNWNGTNYTLFNQSTVLFLAFNNISALGENSSKAVDISNSSNNASLDRVSVFNNSAKYGGSYELDGRPNIRNISVTDSNSLDLTNFTISLWFVQRGAGTTVTTATSSSDVGGAIIVAPLVSKGITNGGTNSNYMIGVATNKLQADALSSGGSHLSITGATTTLNNNTWYHAVFTYNSTTGVIYLNGVSEATKVSGIIPMTNSFSLGIGMAYNNTPNIAHGSFNGTIDEVMIWNGALSAAEVTELYFSNLYKFNTTNWVLYVNQSKNATAGLNNGVYTYFASAKGTGRWNSTDVRTVQTINVVPQNSSTKINATLGTNKTLEDLNCFDNVIDPDGGKLNVSVEWYNQSILHLAINYNNSYTNNTFFSAVLDNANTTKGHNWTCAMRLFDGTSYSSWINSSTLRILNSLPTVVLSSPANGNVTTNRTPTFSWIGNDNDPTDNSSLQFELNLSCYYVPGGACNTDNRYVVRTELNSTKNHTVGPYLKFLSDNNYYYNWTARAWDGDSFGVWTSPSRNISIQSEISISVPVNIVSFGSLNLSQTKNSSTDNPSPIVLRNDGNALANISVNFTSLFLRTLNPTNNFQYQIRNTTGGCFAASGTQTTFAQAPLVLTRAINQLNFTSGYQTGCNNVSVDILVTIPTDEPAANKTSVVTFVASLGEPGIGTT